MLRPPTKKHAGFSEGKTYLESCRRLVVALGVVVAGPKHGQLPERVWMPVIVCESWVYFVA